MTTNATNSARSNYRPEHLAHMERRNVLPLDLLSPDSQRAAVQNILATDQMHYRRAIQDARYQIKANLHAAINDPHLIPSLVRRARHLATIRRDERRCRGYILDNLCEFSADGQYRPLRTEAHNVASHQIAA